MARTPAKPPVPQKTVSVVFSHKGAAAVKKLMARDRKQTPNCVINWAVQKAQELTVEAPRKDGK